MITMIMQIRIAVLARLLRQTRPYPIKSNNVCHFNTFNRADNRLPEQPEVHGGWGVGPGVWGVEVDRR